ncbi:MAG: hypothetical protein ACT452_09770 [Microthrixaceae bacterium]
MGLGESVQAVRIVVRLSPALVADLLARLLDAPHLDIVIDTTNGSVAVDGDLLVTSARLTGPAPRVVVMLDEPIAPGVATVLVDGTAETVVVDDLAAVAAVVRQLCPAPS